MIGLGSDKTKNYIEQLSHFLKSKLPTEPDGKPIENLSKRYKADPKAKSTEAAKAGDEVQPSHLWQPLKL